MVVLACRERSKPDIVFARARADITGKLARECIASDKARVGIGKLCHLLAVDTRPRKRGNLYPLGIYAYCNFLRCACEASVLILDGKGNLIYSAIGYVRNGKGGLVARNVVAVPVLLPGNIGKRDVRGMGEAYALSMRLSVVDRLIVLCQNCGRKKLKARIHHKVARGIGNFTDNPANECGIIVEGPAYVAVNAVKEVLLGKRVAFAKKAKLPEHYALTASECGCVRIDEMHPLPLPADGRTFGYGKRLVCGTDSLPARIKGEQTEASVIVHSLPMLAVAFVFCDKRGIRKLYGYITVLILFLNIGLKIPVLGVGLFGIGQNIEGYVKLILGYDRHEGATVRGVICSVLIKQVSRHAYHRTLGKLGNINSAYPL